MNTQLEAHSVAAPNPASSLSEAAARSSGSSQPKKHKRRRSRKGLAKTFACPEPNCGKKFTRQEHLSRHQLNHKPKEIFICQWPDCNREFVRDDLRLRHYNRHLRRNGPINQAVASPESSTGVATRATTSTANDVLSPESSSSASASPEATPVATVGGAVDPSRRPQGDNLSSMSIRGPASQSSLPSYETLLKQRQQQHHQQLAAAAAARGTLNLTGRQQITDILPATAHGSPALPFPWLHGNPGANPNPTPSSASANSPATASSPGRTSGPSTGLSPNLPSPSPSLIMGFDSSSSPLSSSSSSSSSSSHHALQYGTGTSPSVPAMVSPSLPPLLSGAATRGGPAGSGLASYAHHSIPQQQSPHLMVAPQNHNTTSPGANNGNNPAIVGAAAVQPAKLSENSSLAAPKQGEENGAALFNDDLTLGLFNPLFSMSPTLLFSEPDPSTSHPAAGPLSAATATSAPSAATATVPAIAALSSATDGNANLVNSPLNTNELISWLFSDAIIQNVRDPVLSPSYPSTDSPMALQNLLAPPVPSSQGELIALSEAKRQKLLQLIPEVVSAGTAPPPVADIPAKLTVPPAQVKPEDFYLHTTMPYLQKYIANYWIFFHTQYPILHRPTFTADNCPEGLLWVLIIIGSTFDRADDFALSVADPLRWILFGSPEFTPPAKLWVIQALLLLEMYEKTMSNRKLHIRGHIHHGSILQLIRRGPMLTGSSMSSWRPSSIDGNPLATGGIYEGGTAGSSSSQHWELDPWRRWIQFEETKRAALLAFILDTNHATMFGHTSLLAVHELRVSLPCSRELWECSNPDQLSRYFSRGNGSISGSHHLTPNGYGGATTVPFIEALKMTLNNQAVNTESFGRKVILSGLMSIQHNMQQRDLQVLSLGWDAIRGTWRDAMRKAYMFWRNDYKADLIRMEQKRKRKRGNVKSVARKKREGGKLQQQFECSQDEEDEVEYEDDNEYEGQAQDDGEENIIRVSLTSQETANAAVALLQQQHLNQQASADPGYQPPHSFATRFVLEVGGCADPFLHLAMIHMSISQLDLQYYCGAPSIFNNSLKRCDYAAAERRIRDWVNSPQGTEALHFAVHFLKEMYLVEHAYGQARDVDVCPNPYIVPEQRAPPRTRSGSNGSHHAAADAEWRRRTNPYLAVHDPIPHRPFILFICTMVVWTYAYELQGSEATDLWVPPPPLPAATTATPKLLGHHVFQHMRTVPHQRDGLEYIAWLSQETSRSTPGKMCWKPAGKALSQTAGLLKLVIESLHNHQWELVNEGERLLTNCLERSFGKSETKCHYLRWET